MNHKIKPISLRNFVKVSALRGIYAQRHPVFAGYRQNIMKSRVVRVHDPDAIRPWDDTANAPWDQNKSVTFTRDDSEPGGQFWMPKASTGAMKNHFGSIPSPWNLHDGMGNIGYLNACQLSSEDIFARKTLERLEFIEKFMIDLREGEWFLKVNREGVPYPQMKKHASGNTHTTTAGLAWRSLKDQLMNKKTTVWLALIAIPLIDLILPGCVPGPPLYLHPPYVLGFRSDPYSRIPL